MKKIFLYIITIFLLVHNSFGDTNSIENKLDQLYSKARFYMFTNHDSMDYFSKKAINLIPELTSEKAIADSYFEVAETYLRSGLLDSAEIYFNKSLEVREQIKDYVGVGSIKNKFGYIALLKNDVFKSRDLYQEAIHILKTCDNKEELGKAQNNLASLYTRWGDYNNAINLFQNALENYKSVDYAEGIGWLNFSIAVLYKRVGEYEKSLRYSKNAFHYYAHVMKAGPDSIGIRLCYNQLGFIYTHHFDSLEKGLKCQLEALRLSKRVNMKAVTADAYSGVGQTYYKMGKLDLAKDYLKDAYKLRAESGHQSGIASNLKFLGYIAADENHLPKALAYYDSALVHANELQTKSIKCDLFLAYSKVYEKQKNYSLSLDYYKRHLALKDSILSSEIAKEVASTELRYEIERKNKENEILASQNEIQKLTIEHTKFVRNFLIFMIITSITVLAVVIFLYNKQRQIKTLKGLIPICANCKKIRNDKGIYEQIEHYISEHSDANFSHGICPECMQKLHPELYDQMDKENYFQK